MSLRDDPNYFPQPDVPSDGNYTGNFGRELLYYGYSPRSASIEAANAAAGPKTATSGKYTFDPATGQYTWVPAGSTVKTDTAADYKSGNDSGRGNDGIGGGNTTPDWGTTLSLGQKLSDLGLTTLGDYLQSEGRMGINAQTGAYSQDAQNQRAAEAAAMNTETAEQAQQDIADRSGMPTGGGGYSPGTSGSDSRDSSTAEREANGGVVGRYASGGLGSLGSYSDGGRLLRGPGDGVSDSIPATIGKVKRPARLADGEFVVPARIVSELGNGSTEAGARKLYAMLDRIQKGRKKSIGKGKVAVNSRMDKHLPA